MADFLVGAMPWVFMGLLLAISISYLNTRKKNEDFSE